VLAHCSLVVTLRAEAITSCAARGAELENHLSSGFQEKLVYNRKNGEAKREEGSLLHMLNPRRRSRFITSEWSTKRFTYIPRPIHVKKLWDQMVNEQRALTRNSLISIAKIQPFRFLGGRDSVPLGRIV
jgi:hypothetical protein